MTRQKENPDSKHVVIWCERGRGGRTEGTCTGLIIQQHRESVKQPAETDKANSNLKPPRNAQSTLAFVDRLSHLC